LVLACSALRRELAQQRHHRSGVPWSRGSLRESVLRYSRTVIRQVEGVEFLSEI
jgi:hypothetical protein